MKTNDSEISGSALPEQACVITVLFQMHSHCKRGALHSQMVLTLQLTISHRALHVQSAPRLNALNKELRIQGQTGLITWIHFDAWVLDLGFNVQQVLWQKQSNILGLVLGTMSVTLFLGPPSWVRFPISKMADPFLKTLSKYQRLTPLPVAS